MQIYVENRDEHVSPVLERGVLESQTDYIHAGNKKYACVDVKVCPSCVRSAVKLSDHKVGPRERTLAGTRLCCFRNGADYDLQALVHPGRRTNTSETPRRPGRGRPSTAARQRRPQ